MIMYVEHIFFIASSVWNEFLVSSCNFVMSQLFVHLHSSCYIPIITPLGPDKIETLCFSLLFSHTLSSFSCSYPPFCSRILPAPLQGENIAPFVICILYHWPSYFLISPHIWEIFFQHKLKNYKGRGILEWKFQLLTIFLLSTNLLSQGSSFLGKSPHHLPLPHWLLELLLFWV